MSRILFKLGRNSVGHQQTSLLSSTKPDILLFDKRCPQLWSAIPPHTVDGCPSVGATSDTIATYPVYCVCFSIIRICCTHIKGIRLLGNHHSLSSPSSPLRYSYTLLLSHFLPSSLHHWHGRSILQSGNPLWPATSRPSSSTISCCFSKPDSSQ
jgi:hypothetical protein